MRYHKFTHKVNPAVNIVFAVSKSKRCRMISQNLFRFWYGYVGNYVPRKMYKSFCDKPYIHLSMTEKEYKEQLFLDGI